MFARVQTSKHKTAPFKGNIKLNHDSSLRKLMRAARRGRLDDSTAQVVIIAMTKAASRPADYYGGAPARKKLRGI
jgi:hypothetical protein